MGIESKYLPTVLKGGSSPTELPLMFQPSTPTVRRKRVKRLITTRKHSRNTLLKKLGLPPIVRSKR